MRHVVLVSDPGGHLALLHWLRPQLEGWRRTWVSLDTVDVRGRVGDDPVIFGVGPTARAPGPLVRNLRRARRILPRLRADLVLSSGAGLGVPWLWAGASLGVPTAFLEVADRRDRASLAQRLVAPVVDHLLVQFPGAGARGGAHCVGRIAPPLLPGGQRSGPVFVAFGTSPHPFERLVVACEELAASGHDVLVQHGASRAPYGCRAVGVLPPSRFQEQLATARAVVLHGGLASQAEARALGRVPLVVPRRVGEGEHVDDHQLAAVEEPGTVVVAPEELRSVLDVWEEPDVVPPLDAEARRRFRRWLDQAVPST